MLYMITHITKGASLYEIQMVSLEEPMLPQTRYIQPPKPHFYVGQTVSANSTELTNAPDEKSDNCNTMVVVNICKNFGSDGKSHTKYHLLSKKFGYQLVNHIDSSPAFLGISLYDKVLVETKKTVKNSNIYKIIRNLTKEQIFRDILTKQI